MRATPGIAIVEAFYAHSLFFVAIPFAIATIMTFVAWTWWRISYFQIDEYGITYKMGPFQSNTIPLRNVQDIRSTRGMLGVIFGYGTLIVDSGRMEETLSFVPDIDDFIAAFRQPRRH